jgi:uncharacterized protein
MSSELSFYLVAIPAVIVLGLSKGGFAAVNLIKLPPYFLLGQFSRENLKVSAALIPLAILSTFAGVWLVRRVDADRFYAIILVITFLIGVKLTYDALHALV